MKTYANIFLVTMYMRKRVVKVFVLTYMSFFLYSANVVAFEAASYHHNQQWIQYYNRINGHKFSLLSDASVRWKDAKQVNLLLVRAGVAFRVNDNFSFSTGMASTLQSPFNQNSILELRPFQDVTFVKSFNRISLNVRTRMEERIFRSLHCGELIGTSTIYYRIRQKCMLEYYFYKTNTKNSRIQVGDELFISYQQKSRNPYFDFNRFLFGIAYQANTQTTFTLMYVNQYGALPKEQGFYDTQIIWISLTQNFSIKRK